MPIISCCNKQFTIPYDGKETVTRSEYIQDVINLSNGEDVTIPIPDRYCTVVDNYVQFSQDNQVPITSRERLLLCFQLETLLADDGYHKYCVQQTFNNWSYMCNMVYNEFNDDMRWSLLVLAPYDFIPKRLLRNDTFMAQWSENNIGRVINVNNDNEVYYNNVETLNKNNQKVVKTYHTINGEPDVSHANEVGHKKETVYHKNSNEVDGCWVDGKRDGVWRWWYDNDQHTLRSEGHYVDGKEDGTWRWWYSNDQQTTGSLRHTLESEGHYVNGKLDGVRREWYNNDQHTLKSERNYVDGKLNGTWRWWYNNDQHTLESEEYYVAGKLDGVRREWYDNDQHTLRYEKHYVDGKVNGVWREWYNNDQHTLKFEEHYVDGKRHGRWLEFDLNGNITSDDVYINDVKQ